jgi:hypothetical protein
MRRFANMPFGWQTGYGGFSVCQSNVEQVRQHILTQEEHDRHVWFQEEFVAFLKRVSVDPRLAPVRRSWRRSAAERGDTVLGHARIWVIGLPRPSRVT